MSSKLGPTYEILSGGHAIYLLSTSPEEIKALTMELQYISPNREITYREVKR